MVSLKGSTLGFLEDDTVLAEMNQKFGGNYLGETTLIAAARAKGWQTAIIGKEGPARIQDSTAAPDGNETLILDDATGSEGGLGPAQLVQPPICARPLSAPSRRNPACPTSSRKSG